MRSELCAYFETEKASAEAPKGWIRRKQRCVCGRPSQTRKEHSGTLIHHGEGQLNVFRITATFLRFRSPQWDFSQTAAKSPGAKYKATREPWVDGCSHHWFSHPVAESSEALGRASCSSHVMGFARVCTMEGNE